MVRKETVSNINNSSNNNNDDDDDNKHNNSNNKKKNTIPLPALSVATIVYIATDANEKQPYNSGCIN